MVRTSKFSSGIKILCFHGPLLYEAKILKQEFKRGRFTYFVHYSGWNKNWDEWVTEARMLEINAKNLKRQKDLANSILAGKKGVSTPQSGKKKGTSSEKKTTPALPKSVKPKTLVTPSSGRREFRKITRSHPKELNVVVVATSAITPIANSKSHQTSLEEESDCMIITPRRIPIARKKIETTFEESAKTTDEDNLEKIKIDEAAPKVKLTLPCNLILHVTGDFDMINNKKKLFHLPARISVDDMIALYLNMRTVEDGMTINERTAIEEVCNGIRCYFNFILRNQLLYACEKSQLQNLISENPNKRMSELYGPFHLLRLLSKLQWLLSYTRLDEKGVNLITRHSTDFINYLSESEHRYFHFNEYDDAPSEHSEPPSS